MDVHPPQNGDVPHRLCNPWPHELTKTHGAKRHLGARRGRRASFAPLAGELRDAEAAAAVEEVLAKLNEGRPTEWAAQSWGHIGSSVKSPVHVVLQLG